MHKICSLIMPVILIMATCLPVPIYAEDSMIFSDKKFVVYEEPATVIQYIAIEPEVYMPESDIKLIALVMMAEAEGEPETGKRLVIDTILNRIDSPHFPNTVSEVIYQKNQFESMWNGRANRVSATDEACALVREELISRTNSEVVFFMAGKYSKYGQPMFNVCCHYFSKY